LKVVISGAGEVGYHVVGALYREGVDIVAIDHNQAILEQLRQEYNITTILGNAIDSDVLVEARVSEADLFLAITNYDETNIIACLMAGEVGAAMKIARVKTIDFGHETAVSDQTFPGIDLVINPYEVAAEHLTDLVSSPPVTDYNHFLADRVAMVRIPIERGSPLAEVSAMDFARNAQIPQTLMVLIQRGGTSTIPHGEDVIHAGDQVYFICEHDQLKRLYDYLELPHTAARRVFINGGGNVGYALARRLERKGLDVRILEISEARCETLSQLLDRTLVLNADGSDSQALKSEGIDHADYFVSVTAEDQTNVVSALLARQYGARHTIALVKQQEMIPIVMGGRQIDIAFSPRLLTARKLLRFVRGTRLDSFFSFPNSDIELLELRIEPGMKCEEGTLASLDLPSGVLVGAVKRDAHIFIPHGDDRIQAGDTILVIQQRRNRRVTRGFFLEPAAPGPGGRRAAGGAAAGRAAP